MRWTEQQLKHHQNNRENRDKTAVTKQNEKIRTDVADKLKQADMSEIKSICENGLKQLLNCEIGMIPPSVNHYWERSGRGYRLSNKAHDFHDLVRAIVPALQTTARLKLEVTFHFQNKQRRDIDNYLKATIDSLVKCDFCVDDEQFDELVVKRGEIVKGGLLKLTVSEV
ncbi:RusA family crossover junction endodeoxyribonuclease [Acinetobacter proteolyticus]|nr:RusA family crossover junction endodeoxyribonuclease [Acinetobacter proteolyticus]WEI17378.1 RusA family crossover junction endodeoxyribonuclease [Acinetobacter proteolyticus]